MSKSLIRRAGVALAATACTWLWLALATGRGFEILRVLLTDAFLILPLGALIVEALIPEARRHPAARVGLAAAAGYATTTFVAVILGSLHALPAYPWVPAVPAAVWLILAWRRSARPARVRQFRDGAFSWQSAAAMTLLVIVCLSLVVITPFMTPLAETAPGRFLSYAYVDAFQGLTMVQRLARQLPLLEDISFAGIQARVYPDFHYVYLAMLKRLTGAAASDLYFVHGPMLLVLLGVPLAYAVGRELTGHRLGGYVAATLLCLGVIPNVYDLNLSLSPVSTPYMPTFYQTHFFSPRYNQHEGAGDIMILATALTVVLADQLREGRSRMGALVLGACFVAALIRFRSQHLLAIAPAFVVVCGGLAFKRSDWRYLVGVAGLGVGILVVLAELTSGNYDVKSLRLVLSYGSFGRDLLSRWYLPARLQTSIAHLPSLLAPIVAVVVWVIFRLVGMALALLILAHLWQLVRRRQWPTPYEWMCATAFVAALVAALVLRRPGIAFGQQVVQVTHILAVLLAIVPAYGITQAVARAGRSATFNRILGAAVLAGFTFVAYRGATAAMRDQAYRAFPLTAAERDVYQWIHTHTPDDAVFAAHPDHLVSLGGDTVQSTLFLSAMTDRPVYHQRTGISGKRKKRRAAVIRRLFAAPTPTAACSVLAEIYPLDYLIEYPDTPFLGRSGSCLQEVFATGGVRVLRVVPTEDARSSSPRSDGL